MNRTLKHIRYLSILLICYALIVNTAYPASAIGLEGCRIATSKNSWVSLGFPVAKERLTGNPKILVIPFKLKDTPYVFTDNDRYAADEAARIIQKMSGNQSNPTIVFAPLQELDSVKDDIVQLKVNQQNGWQKKDETQSTWGFVRKVVSAADPKIDYSNVDAVILQGPTSTDQEWIGKSSIGEAMMFLKDSGDPFFRPLVTSEATIYNASLITGGSLGSATTFAHEIMHLYGLTDLYGGISSPSFFSLMAANNHRLLAHERWVLGWLPDSQVTCLNGSDSGELKKEITEIKLKNDINDQLVMISQNNSTDAIVIEKNSIVNNGTSGIETYLSFYLLENEKRPPIYMYSVSGSAPNVLTYTNRVPSTRYISSVFKGDEYQLLISNIDELGITLNLVPNQESSKLNGLQTAARNLQIEAEAKAKEKAMADAEAKAKAEAEAKAKAESIARSSTKVLSVLKTIVCTKGKSTKKISALKPKCPAGFKQR